MSHPSPTPSDTPAPVVALAIVNARVWTGDRRRPWADAVLVRGERVELVGSSAEVKKLAGGVRTLDARGMMVVPAFVDGVGPSVARIHAAIVQRSARGELPSSESGELGVLAAGMRADLVLLDRDITRMATAAAGEARVMVTMVGGRVVYDRDVLLG